MWRVVCRLFGVATTSDGPRAPYRGPLRVQVNSLSHSSLIMRLSSSCSLTNALNSSADGSSTRPRASRILSSTSRWRLIASASCWRSSAIVTPAEATGPSAYGSGGGAASGMFSSQEGHTAARSPRRHRLHTYAVTTMFVTLNWHSRNASYLSPHESQIAGE